MLISVSQCPKWHVHVTQSTSIYTRCSSFTRLMKTKQLPTYFPIPRNNLKSLSNFLAFIVAQLITQTICINKDVSICCMANGLRGRCFYPCIHVTGLDTLFEQMYTIWKCRVPQWNVSNCFLSKCINAICTCIYVNDIKAAGVPAKWELMLRNIYKANGSLRSPSTK